MKIKRKEFGSLLQLICFSSSSYILTEFLRSISQAAKRRIAVICLIIDSRSLSGVIRVKSMIRREKKNSSHKKWIILIFVSFFFFSGRNLPLTQSLTSYSIHRISGIHNGFLSDLLRLWSALHCLLFFLSQLPPKQASAFIKWNNVYIPNRKYQINDSLVFISVGCILKNVWLLLEGKMAELEFIFHVMLCSSTNKKTENIQHWHLHSCSIKMTSIKIMPFLVFCLFLDLLAIFNRSFWWIAAIDATISFRFLMDFFASVK